ncbi:MAG: hypothetical protein RR540_08165 [Oscillospiraceae bacterium]
MYEKLQKKTGKRNIAIMILIGVVGIMALVFALINLLGGGIGSNTNFLEQAQQIAEENGSTLSDEEIAHFTMLDENSAKSATSKTGGIVTLAFALVCFGAIFLINKNNNVLHSKLGKMAADYTANLGEKDMAAALDEIESELSNPIFDSPQFTLTENWLIGQIGATRKAVAVPIGAISGVYYYYLIRQVTGERNATGYFYQILINDKFDKDYILQFKNLKQLDEVFDLLCKTCKNADKGSYDEEYLNGYCVNPKEERLQKITDILAKNKSDGMKYCEI